MACYYKTLGISTRATPEEIKKAFRMLALRWHPDRNPHDPRGAERFREAVEAYETLVDPKRRAHYDRGRGYGKSRKNSQPRGRGTVDSGEDRFESFEEFFAEMFGVEVSAKRGLNTSDLRFDLQVARSALQEGTFEEIRYTRCVFCDRCRSNGGGRALQQSCEKCLGEGELEEICSLRVWIPPGSGQGARLRIPGAGDQLIPGCAPGDLVILLHIVEGA